MKKLKIILFISTILLCAVFLFATCRKTKAYYTGDSYDNGYYITATDSNSSIIITYKPAAIPNSSQNLFSCGVSTSYNDEFIYGVITYNSTGTQFTFILKDRTGNQLLTPNIITYTNRVQEIVVCIAPNNDDYIAFLIDFITYSNNLELEHNIFIYYTEHTIYEQDFTTAFLSSQGLYVVPAVGSRFSSQNWLKGNYNSFVFDYLDYNIAGALSEMYNDIYDDYIATDTSMFQAYNNGYSVGYTNGYQAGYDDGYADGQTAGYNSGYNTGYADGLADNTTAYNHGYDDGRADGYREGLVNGYDDGYATGYNVGFTEGQAGATPVSKTIGVVSSIFAGIGEVLAVELFPGFTIGILILVPLFFGVLGLILWIWRRN